MLDYAFHFPYSIFLEIVGILKAESCMEEASDDLRKPRLSMWLSLYSTDSQLEGRSCAPGDI